MVGLAGAFAATIVVATGLADRADGAARGSVVAEGAIAVDGPTVFLWGVLLVLSFVSVLLFAERHLDGGVTAFAGQAAALPGTEAEREASTRGLEHTEVFPLMMFAVSGMMLFPASNDLLTMFVALEVLSLPLYLLCGLARRRRLLSQEAALKYFMLGAFSSGFFLYGVALTYGYAGSMNFADIAESVSGRIGGHQQVDDFAGLQLSSVQAVLFYLVTYGFMTIGAFAVVTVVRDAGGEATHLSRWAGLGKESPVVAGVFAFFLLSMAGIPLTSGFTGKWAGFAP